MSIIEANYIHHATTCLALRRQEAMTSPSCWEVVFFLCATYSVLENDFQTFHICNVDPAS